MNQDRFWELISLKLSGEAKPSELTELESFLQANPDEGLRIETLMAIWDSRQDLAIQKKEAFSRHMQRLSNHLSEPVLQYEHAVLEQYNGQEEQNNKPRGTFRKIAWAAGIAASLLTGVFIISTITGNKKETKANAHNTVSTKRGSKSKINLPDGTQVWLNADSRITYNENFQGSLREVELTGEAFFDVVRDETRPFIIHTAAIDVKVLGTAFNVRSYAEEKNTETSLIRGSVEITLVNSPDKKKIILKPNDKLIVNNSQATVLQQSGGVKPNSPVLTLGKINYIKKDSIAVETLWTRNKLAFDKESLEDIALKIERWYDVKVMIVDEKLKKEFYTATFDDETLLQVMEALQEGGGFQYSINKKEVMISADK
ncbi:MAG: FecR domain-containing protein [Ferruginibacter sp.]|nr:FecR domain-containing protein [Chitinophagaceae bacterium]